ncbi:MAG TPA: FAD-dependent oxidoreductase [Steroidobacteraceae bacterium]|jgi:predicted NAD/FAD-binding protein|nr:FAD-dependent oxidoreductase [Steroidobacteraceae bacterium]
MRVAVIGSGISGMVAAARLHRRHEVTVFEASSHIGGHTNTVDVDFQGRHYAVDTGFIVFNDWTYPRFIALLDELGVEYQRSNMSFSLRDERCGLEYNGTNLNGLFAQRLNALRPSFLRMIADILRFNKQSRELLAGADGALTLGAYLDAKRYSRAFREQFIVPMGMSIWSATERAMLSFPARFFVEFFDKHGFLNVNDRPVWRAVKGGAREYMKKLAAPLLHRIRLNTTVTAVRRDPAGVTVRTALGSVERFDYLVVACHSDQALKFLTDASDAEREVLGAFPYQENEAVLHTDERLLPRTKRARAAWNYHLLAVRDNAMRDRVALTYDMNVLQSLDAPVRFLLTLNRGADIDPAKAIKTFTYHHPVYLPAGVAAQKRRAEVSGVNRTLYCGAYWRYGFHEDGVVSAEWALADFARITGDAQNASFAMARAI